MRALMIAAVITAMTPALADAKEQVGRYSSVEAAPTEAQAQPLEAVVQITFPQEIVTVGEALEHLLKPSGYAFQELSATSVLTSRPLPEVHRELGPMPLYKALKTLSGPPWRLLVDPVARTVAFEPKSPYREGAEASAERLTGEQAAPVEPRTFGPVARGASLYQIAARVEPKQPKAASQAVYEANPQAFIRGDPNRLIAGATLEIPPSEEIAARDPDKAESWFNEVTR